jgi:hypothetical protein
MQTAKIKNRAFIFNNIRYFTTQAENISLAAYGEKIRRMTGVSYVLVERAMNLEGAEIDRVDAITFDFRSVRKADLEFGVPLKAADMSAGIGFEDFRSRNVVLLKLSLKTGVLKDVFSAGTPESKRALEYLRTAKTPRVVNHVFVVVSAALANKLSARGDLNATSRTGGIDLYAKVGGELLSESTMVLSKGTVLAYGMLRPVFTETGEILRFVPDHPGIG